MGEYRIGGFGLSEPIKEVSKRRVTIENPNRINTQYPNWNMVLVFEGTHIREKDEYVWVVYKDSILNFEGIIGTLRMIREMDERGFSEIHWSDCDGNECTNSIYKDNMRPDYIQRFIENRIVVWASKQNEFK